MLYDSPFIKYVIFAQSKIVVIFNGLHMAFSGCSEKENLFFDFSPQFSVQGDTQFPPVQNFWSHLPQQHKYYFSWELSPEVTILLYRRYRVWKMNACKLQINNYYTRKYSLKSVCLLFTVNQAFCYYLYYRDWTLLHIWEVSSSHLGLKSKVS